MVLWMLRGTCRSVPHPLRSSLGVCLPVDGARDSKRPRCIEICDIPDVLVVAVEDGAPEVAATRYSDTIKS